MSNENSALSGSDQTIVYCLTYSYHFPVRDYFYNTMSLYVCIINCFCSSKYGIDNQNNPSIFMFQCHRQRSHYNNPTPTYRRIWRKLSEN